MSKYFDNKFSFFGNDDDDKDSRMKISLLVFIDQWAIIILKFMIQLKVKLQPQKNIHTVDTR